MKRFVLTALGLTTAVLLMLASIFFWQIQKTAVLDKPVVLTLTDGTTAREIGKQLKDQEVIPSVWAFQLYALMDGSYQGLQSGTYRFESGDTIITVVRDISSGGGINRELTVRIVEGWNKYDISRFVDEELGLYGYEEMLTVIDVHDSRVLFPNRTFDFLRSKPPDQGLEGYLFPDTYRVYIDGEPKDLIEKMLENFDRKLTSALRERAAEEGFSLHAVVTLASIVEKEVRLPRDKKIVAGIFRNRLETGMPLQADSTINYVTGKSVTRVSEEDLEIDSLYNTYRHRGLPPGPIANPGIESIEAVLFPEDTPYLYFITGPDLSVHYSSTFEEHVQKKFELYP